MTAWQFKSGILEPPLTLTTLAVHTSAAVCQSAQLESKASSGNPFTNL